METRPNEMVSFDGNQTFTLENWLMVESNGSAFAKGCLEGIIRHLLAFLAHNIIFIGQLEEDIELCLRVAQYLSPADQ